MKNTEKNEILVAIGKINGKLDTMQGQITEIQKEVAKIPEMQKEIAKIPEMQKEIAKIPEMQKEVAKIPEMQKEIAKISEMQKEIRNISRSVAVIEHEHGDKLKALFDAFITNTEKIKVEEERIHFCERKLENHDIEIDYLKSKVQGL